MQIDDPQILALLARIEASPAGEADHLYEAVGRRLHVLLQQGHGTDADDWDELGEDELTDIPSPHQLEAALAAARVDRESIAPGPVARLADLRLERTQGASALAVTQGSGVPWRALLDELLDLIELPPNPRAANVVPSEATRIQWASAEVGSRLSVFPESVQHALLGMLGARVRNLSQCLAVDIGPRMALERLRRIRASRDLCWVPSLFENPHPETSSWSEDARAYWELLGR